MITESVDENEMIGDAVERQVTLAGRSTIDINSIQTLSVTPVSIFCPQRRVPNPSSGRKLAQTQAVRRVYRFQSRRDGNFFGVFTGRQPEELLFNDQIMSINFSLRTFRDFPCTIIVLNIWSSLRGFCFKLTLSLESSPLFVHEHELRQNEGFWKF
jgi:hypothetical protein